jgi:2,4-didehydro-3-deoxy-L-rhamnonate hydrolase
MRFVSYLKPDQRDPRDRMMGVVMGDKVAPLADIDTFYDDLPSWKGHAAALKKGDIPLAGLPLAPPVPRDAKIVCAAIN